MKNCPVYSFYAIADNEDLAQAHWYRTYSWPRKAGWVDDFTSAKIWTRKAQAQGKCTALGGRAFLVELTADRINIIDQRERLRQRAEKKRADEEQRRKSQAERELEAAERMLKAARENVERLKGPRAHARDCGCKSCMGM